MANFWEKPGKSPEERQIASLETLTEKAGQAREVGLLFFHWRGTAEKGSGG
jgi:hypothetical protein